MAKNGADVLIYVRTAVGPPEVYAVVGSQRDVSIDENVDTIDGSSKDQPEARVDAGRYSSSFSLDEVYVPTDAGYAQLKASFRARTKIKVRVREFGVDAEEAMALITKLSRNYPDQGECTVSLDFTVDGAWSAVA